MTPLAVLRQLQLTTLRPLAELLGSDERSRLRGPGMELSEVRAYQPGDDIRYIDWNITARTDEPYVREATVERGLDVWLLVDVSPSLAWGTADSLKRDRAEELVAVAGLLAAQRGHRVGALFFAGRVAGVVPPRVGRQHLLRILTELRAAEALRQDVVRHGAELLVLSTAEELLPALRQFLAARRLRRAVRLSPRRAA